MKENDNFATAECPVARTLGVLGDKWSLMIIRDAFDGIGRFSDLQKSTGAAKNILAARLKQLVSAGVLETIPAAEGSAYHAYQLSAKGRALFPLIISLRQWGEEYLFSAGETHSLLQDSRNGEPLEKLQVRNRRGEVLEPAQSVRIRVVK